MPFNGSTRFSPPPEHRAAAPDLAAFFVGFKGAAVARFCVAGVLSILRWRVESWPHWSLAGC